MGLAAGRAFADRAHPARRGFIMRWLAILSFLPDLDVLGLAAGVPYSHPWGHRGAPHSLALAAALGLVAWPLLLRAGFKRPGGLALTLALVVGSHGLLDMFTDGGLGIAVLWPVSDERFFAPWQPLPVAPIGRAILSARGMFVLGVEALYFLPFFLYALWPRRRALPEA